MFSQQGVIWVASIQQDISTDPPFMTKGMPYVGRQGIYERGEANIPFVLGQLKNCSRTLAMAT
jgi:hypothetical protein